MEVCIRDKNGKNVCVKPKDIIINEMTLEEYFKELKQTTRKLEMFIKKHEAREKELIELWRSIKGGSR